MLDLRHFLTTAQSRCLALSIATVWTAAGGAAFAQNALGDGRGLQQDLRRDLSTTGIGNTPVRDFNAELRFRNSIVTGSAPGGMAFRGDVGYRDPGEFLGTLGSDDLYGFRRDSLYSGLAGAGIRGTDALQYQFALTTGNTSASQFSGSLAVPRTGSFVNRDPLTYSVDPNRWENVQGSLRSTASYSAVRSLQPALMGVRVDRDLGVRQRVVASSNLGVHASEWERANLEQNAGAVPQMAGNAAGQFNPDSMPGIEPPGGARRVENTLEGIRDRLRGIPAMPQTAPASGGPVNSVPAGAAPSGSPGAGPLEQPVTGFDSQLDRLRARLRGDPGAAAPGLPEAAPDPAGRAGERVGLVDPLSRIELDEIAKTIRSTAGKQEEEEDSLVTLDPTGVYPPAEKTYGEQMVKGQQQLAAGQYFFAEERFSLALALRPGDAAAMLGRIHAELGAGLFVSASMNLRTYLKEHPELAAVKFSPKLTPGAERLTSLKQQLRDAINSNRGAAGDPGLLLAYVGYQTDDSAALDAGMAAVKQGASSADASTASGRAEVALSEFLQRVWGGGPAGTPEK